MADIEDAEFGDDGRIREWLARAVKAPRDAAWVADGHVSDHWAPVSPVTGKLDAFEWKVPSAQLDGNGMPAIDWDAHEADLKSRRAALAAPSTLAAASPVADDAEVELSAKGQAETDLSTKIVDAETVESDDRDKPLLETSAPVEKLDEPTNEISSDSEARDDGDTRDKAVPASTEVEEPRTTQSVIAEDATDDVESVSSVVKQDADNAMDGRPDDPGVRPGDPPRKSGGFRLFN